MTLGMRHHIATFSVGFVLLIVSWWDAVDHMVGILWNVDVFAHGLLVPFVSLAIIWSRREDLSHIPARFSLLGVPVLVVACMLWILGSLLEAKLFAHVALLIAVQGLVIMSLGREIYIKILFPMLFLFLTIPFGYELVGPLQTMTASMVIWVLELLGANYTVEGMVIGLPSGYFEVAEACAGVKFLFTSLVMGILLSNLIFKSWVRRVTIVIVSILLPILANGLRVLGILGISELTDQNFAKGVDHIVYGWVFLSIVLFALIAVAYRFSDKTMGDSEPPRKSDASVPSPGLAKNATVFVSLLLPVSAYWVAPNGPPSTLSHVESSLTQLFSAAPTGYRLLTNTGLISQPYALNSKSQSRSLLRRRGTVFNVYRAEYSELGPGTRLFQPANSLAGPNWKEMKSAGEAMQLSCGVQIEEKLFRRGDERMLIWPVYLVEGLPVRSGLQEKLNTARLLLTKEKARGTILVLSTFVGDDTAAPREVFSEFLSTFWSDSSLWGDGGPSEKGMNLCAE